MTVVMVIVDDSDSCGDGDSSDGDSYEGVCQ